MIKVVKVNFLKDEGTIENKTYDIIAKILIQKLNYDEREKLLEVLRKDKTI